MHIETANDAQWLITHKTHLYTLKFQTSCGKWVIELPNNLGTLTTLEEVFDWIIDRMELE